MKIERIAGSSQYFLLHLCTQVKNFTIFVLWCNLQITCLLMHYHAFLDPNLELYEMMLKFKSEKDSSFSFFQFFNFFSSFYQWEEGVLAFEAADDMGYSIVDKIVCISIF